MRTALVTDPLFFRHDTGPGHPERPPRLRAVLDRLEGLDLVQIPARDATTAELERVHARGYAARIEGRIRAGATALDTDTVVSADSFDAAVRAAGAALALGEAWVDGRIDAGFAAVRPPGHHATPTRPMGFCLFNNVAVLARWLQDQGRRVAIVDWDVHHGNGTQDIFWDDAAVGYCSLHQSPLYPGTGGAKETGAGNIFNLPLPAGTTGLQYRTLMRERVVPWLEKRGPDVVLVSAGFDAHKSDPLGGMGVQADDFAAMTYALNAWPLLSLLEGGYDLDGLGESALAHVQALMAAR